MEAGRQAEDICQVLKAAAYMFASHQHSCHAQRHNSCQQHILGICHAGEATLLMREAACLSKPSSRRSICTNKHAVR